LAEEFQQRGLPVTDQAKVLGLPRSRFYRRKQTSKPASHDPFTRKSEQPTDEEIIAVLRGLDSRYHTYGYRRLRAVLQRLHGWVINHKRLRRLLRDIRWTTQRIARCRRPKESRRPATPTRPNELWQMDMTKFFIPGLGWAHVIAILDVYTRLIVSHRVTLRARAEEWIATWDQALQNEFPDGLRDRPTLTLQVDNGCQPTSRSFLQAVKLCDAQLAFTAVATPEHNAHIERFFRTLKEEEIWPSLYETFEEAKASIDAYVRFYNSERIHSSIGYVPPAEFKRACTVLNAA
jgi:putative transposase